jgi:hypothetical protein
MCLEAWHRRNARFRRWWGWGRRKHHGNPLFKVTLDVQALAELPQRNVEDSHPCMRHKYTTSVFKKRMQTVSDVIYGGVAPIIAGNGQEQD